MIRFLRIALMFFLLSSTMGNVLLAQKENRFVANCTRYKFGNIASLKHFGEAIHELGGSRFIYRLEFPNDQISQLCFGFDGFEYWMLIEEIVETNKSNSIVVRYNKIELLSQELPRGISRLTDRFTGQKIFETIAILENLRSELHLNQIGCSSDDFATAVSNAPDLAKRVENIIEFKEALRLSHETYQVQSLKESLPWKMSIGVDGNPVSSLQIIVCKSHPTAFTGPKSERPLFPMPLLFALKRSKEVEVNVFEFCFQHYAKDESTILTIGGRGSIRNSGKGQN